MSNSQWIILPIAHGPLFMRFSRYGRSTPRAARIKIMDSGPKLAYYPVAPLLKLLPHWRCFVKGPRKIITRLLFSFLSLTLTLFLCVSAFADPPHGKGHGHAKQKRIARSYDNHDWRVRHRGDRRNFRPRSKKELKFINGHDARDGRWDGRGPRPRVRYLPARRRY